jgi:hypothetical protein
MFDTVSSAIDRLPVEHHGNCGARRVETGHVGLHALVDGVADGRGFGTNAFSGRFDRPRRQRSRAEGFEHAFQGQWIAAGSLGWIPGSRESGKTEQGNEKNRRQAESNPGPR